MKFTFFYNTPPWYRFFLTFFVILTLMLISFFVSFLLCIPIFHLSVEEIKNFFVHSILPDNIALLKFLQSVQSIGTFLLPSVLLAWLFSGNISKFLNLNQVISNFTVLMVIISIILAIPLINYTGYLNSMLRFPDSMHGAEKVIRHWEESAGETMEKFLTVTTSGGFLINLFIIAVLPAICEEFLFRGIFQKILIDWTRNKHVGIILAAALFSIFHMQFFGFVPRFLLGVYFGYLLIWTKSLWLPIIAHFINNAFVITFYHFSGESPGNSVVDDLGGADGNRTFLIFSVFLFTLSAISIYYFEQRKKITNEDSRI